MGVWGREGSEQNWSPGLLDRAETFAESGVTLSHSGTAVSGGSVELGSADGSTVSISLGGDLFSVSQKSGHMVNPNTDLYGVTATADPDNVDITTAYLIRDSDGTTLDSVACSPGDTVQLRADMVAGTNYRLVADAGGSAYDVRRNGGASYPYTSADIDLTDGIGKYSGEAYTFNEVQAGVDVLEGSATVEWPMPADLAGWDIIPYEGTKDGGTIEVYAVDPSDGTRLAGPLEDPGDISDPSTFPKSLNVAVEVVLNRTSSSENPRLESIYRRRKIT